MYSYEKRKSIADEYLERLEDYGAELPDGVLLLTAAVDVQGNRLEYEIAGWNAETRWGILRGIIRGAPTTAETWRALDAVLDRTYEFSDGTGLKVSRTFVDSGYATAAVYDYCRANMTKGRFAIKGLGTAGIPLLHKYNQVGGVLLTILGVSDGKQEVLSRFDKWHYPHGRGYDDVYFKQLLSEHTTVKNGKIAWVKTQERNEALDLAYYNLAVLRSCIGNGDEADFWRRRHDELRGEIKKPRAIKKSRAVDIWQ